MTERAEVIVVGMGPGSEDLAERLAVAGLDVVGIDGGLVGGECPYWGCVPSKMMIRAANLLAETGRVKGMAGDAMARPDWTPVASRIRNEATDDWDDQVAVDRFKDKGGRFVRGWGSLDGPSRVLVGDEVFEASKAVVLGVGATPFIPPVTGLADLPYWTNRDAIEATEVPATLAVLGGGAIGVELGQMFARFGSAVTIVESGPCLLPPEEPEAGVLLARIFAAEGITVRTEATVTSVAHDGIRFTLNLADGAPVVAERLLVATGRRPHLEGLGLESIGVAADARAVDVDDHLRVLDRKGAVVDGVWAVGDVTAKGPFTHVSMYQAAIARDDILGRPVVPADYRALPRVTFTDPEIGSVGLSERAARAQGLSVRVGSIELPTSTRGWIHKAGNDGYIKLIEDADRGVLVGASSAGPMGGEVLGFLVLAVHAEVPTETLRHMIYAYPTFHRAIEGALADLAGMSSAKD